MIRPQAAGNRWGGVHNALLSSTPRGTTNPCLTWADAAFSTIHTPYYCY
jgi:hypothetical protein